MQAPPIPPDPNIIIPQLIPLAGMAVGAIATMSLVLGPVGRAIGDVIRHWLGGGTKRGELASAELDEVTSRLEQVQHQLGELAERQDFTERMLAQVRKGQLPPGDVAG